MQQALVYHYWNDRDRKPCTDLRNPIIPSIAILRSWNPSLPVHVIDASDGFCDWKHYPDKLRFTLHRIPPQIPVKFSDRLGINLNSFKYLSKVFDIYNLARELPQETIIFSDSDVFWLRDVLPLEVDDPKGLYCRDEFTGYYYFGKDRSTDEFFRMWKKTILRGLVDRDFRMRVCAHYRHPEFFIEETAYVYLIKTVAADLVHLMGESFNPFNPAMPAHLCRFFHFVGHDYGQSRGLAAFFIKEYFERLRTVLTDRELESLFEKSLHLGGRVVFSDRGRLIPDCVLPFDRSVVI
jgi:hypothetical protein